MKKFLLTGSALFLLATGMLAQKAFIRPSSIGISFVFYDHVTPERIQTASIRQVLKNKQWAKLNEMAPGLGLTYFKGLHPKIDFASSFTGAFVDDALPEQINTGNAFFMQADAMLQFKMFSDKYLFTPYLMGGVGVSKYKVYYGAFMPVGGGFKVNFFNEAAFFINAKYHLPVTANTVKRHFVYGLGIAGIIGKSREL